MEKSTLDIPVKDIVKAMHVANSDLLIEDLERTIRESLKGQIQEGDLVKGFLEMNYDGSALIFNVVWSY